MVKRLMILLSFSIRLISIFLNIGPKLTKNLNTSIKTLLDYNKNTIFFPQITENEILCTVNSLKNAIAGCAQIQTFKAKRSLQYYLKPLTHLINKSIHQDISR